MKCIEGCGADVLEGSTHCRNCGAPQEQTVEAAGGVAFPPPPDETPPQPAAGSPEIAAAPVAVVEPEPVPPKPTTMAIAVSNACRHDIGHVRKDEDDYGKENNQDYTRSVVIDYPAHGFRVILMAGADGIGSSTGGERMAQAVVDLFLGALGARVPVFSLQDQFMDRAQFGEALANKLAKWFFPVVDWTHKMIYSIGENEFPPRKGQRQLFGSTLVATAMICDLSTGRVIVHGYWVGDSRVYLVTRETAECLTKDHDREVGGEKVLDRWVGHIASADGQVFMRELQLSPDNPIVQLLLCSDGLTNMVGPDEIAEVCRMQPAAQAVETLISRAVNCEVPYGRQFQSETAIQIQPGDDNILVNLTRIEGA